MKPGIHYNVPWEAYQEVEGVRSVYLQHLKRSPGHLKAYLEQPRKPDTKALIIGRAIHAAVLEPDRFAGTFVAAPDVDRRTKVGRETWDAFVAETQGKVVMDAEDLQHVQGMADAIGANNAACQVLNLEGTELSLVWVEPETMLTCKGRPDSYTEKYGGLLVDLKSCRSAEPFKFRRDLWEQGYARQIAWYRHGLRLLGKDVGHCLIVAVEKEPPYGVMVYEIQSEVLDKLEYENIQLLHRYKHCQKHNIWPTYPEVVISITLPDWAKIGLEESNDEGNGK